MWGFTLLKNAELKKKEQTIQGLLSDRDLLKKQIATLETLNKNYVALVLNRAKKAELVGIDIADPAPTKPSERKPYIARVAAFHTDILKFKLNHMISNAHSLLEDEDHSRDDDFVLKAVVYVCREFMRWGDQAVNEQISYQSENVEESSSTVEENLQKLIES